MNMNHCAARDALLLSVCRGDDSLTTEGGQAAGFVEFITFEELKGAALASEERHHGRKDWEEVQHGPRDDLLYFYEAKVADMKRLDPHG